MAIVYWQVGWAGVTIRTAVSQSRSCSSSTRCETSPRWASSRATTSPKTFRWVPAVLYPLASCEPVSELLQSSCCQPVQSQSSSEGDGAILEQVQVGSAMTIALSRENAPKSRALYLIIHSHSVNAIFKAIWLAFPIFNAYYNQTSTG